MINIAIFASGRGSNALSIIKAINHLKHIDVSLIVSNKKEAGVLDIAKEWNISGKTITRSDFINTDQLIIELNRLEIDLIVLAGFLWRVPSQLIANFLTLNIHPALLPKFGGKGMYGHHVHEAVKIAEEKQSGITIHWVNDHYDEGQIIFQKTCDLSPADTPEDIAKKVLKLEHEYYPQIVIQEANRIIKM